MSLCFAALEIEFLLFVNVVYCSQINQIPTLIESFSPCIVHILNFDQAYIFKSSVLPVILTTIFKKGTSIIKSSPPRTFRRKYVLCVANILLFPELHTKFTGTDIIASEQSTDKLLNLEWIDDLIIKTSPLYRDEEKRDANSCIEQHFLLVFTIKDPNFWAKGIRYGKISQVARLFIFQIAQMQVHTKWNLIMSKPEVYIIHQISFICFLCSKTGLLLIKLSSSAAYLLSGNTTANKTISKSHLECFENEMTDGGRKIFIVIGNLNFVNHLFAASFGKEFEYPSYLISSKGKHSTPAPFTIHNTTFKINEVMEILLFESLDYTNDSKFHQNLESYQVSEYPGIHPRMRPNIRFQDTRRDKVNFNKAFVMMNDHSFNFITCDGTQISFGTRGIHLSRSFAPYTKSVWIAGSLVLIGFTFFLAILLNNSNSRNCKTRRFNRRRNELFLISLTLSLQLTISSLLENGNDFNLTRYLTSKYRLTIYLTLCGWLLGLFLFNNVYKGVLTSDEVIQAPVTSKWENFCELDNFSFISPAKYEKDYTIKGKSGEKLAISDSFFGSAVLFASTSNEVAQGRINSTTCPIKIQVQSTGSESHSLLLDNYEGFFKFISNCHRTAFADVTYRIDNFLHYFNSRPEAKEKNLHFVKGKDSFLHFAHGYMFHGYSHQYMGRIYDRLQHIIQCGIHKLFDEWLNRRLSIKNEKSCLIKWSPITSQWIVTPMAILLVGYSFGFIFLILEIIGDRINFKTIRISSYNMP